jgi:myo-inositol 2-dehydrogenase/D-chiro-inositol 1-dehydrogenase
MIWAGCGRHAEQMLLPQLVRHDVELVGVCDIDRRAAERVARRHGVPHVATDFAELLALPGLDAAGMAAGPVPHRDLSIAALARGLHVFMEKPCGASAADAQAIADAARAAERTVGVGFMKRFSTANRIAHNVVKAPGFGPVVGFFGEYMTAPTYFAGRFAHRGLAAAGHACCWSRWATARCTWCRWCCRRCRPSSASAAPMRRCPTR